MSIALAGESMLVIHTAGRMGIVVLLLLSA